jgi:O-antigen/teichoic acid export membrane protein
MSAVDPVRGPKDPRTVMGASTVFSDYVSILGAKLGSAVLSTVSVLITTRLLDPSGFGTVAYFVVVAQLLYTVASAWSSTAISRYGREEIELHGSVVTLTWARLAISLPPLVAGVLIVLALEAAGALPAGFGWDFGLLAIAYGLLLIATEHFQYSLDAAAKMKQSAAWTIGQQAAIVATFGVALATDKDVGPHTVVVIYVAWSALFTLALSIRMWGLAIWPPSPNSAAIRRMFRFSVPLIAFTVSQYLIRSVDLLVLGIYASTAAVGLYALAYQSYTVLQGLTIATGPVLTPLFVSLRSAGREHLVRRYLDRIVPTMTLVAAVLAGIAVPVTQAAVPVLFGDRFGDAADPLSILLLAIVIGFSANLLAPIVVLHERTREIGLVNVAAAVVNVVLDFVLIGALDVGITGPAIATVLAITIVLFSYARIALDATGSDVSLGLGFMLAPFACALAIGIAFDGPAGWVAAAVSSIVCGALVLSLRSPLGQEDAALVSQLDMPGPVKRLTLRLLRLEAPKTPAA